MGSAEVCAKKPMNVALFVGLTAGRRICCRVGLAEGDELKSNVLHFCAELRRASPSRDHFLAHRPFAGPLHCPFDSPPFSQTRETRISSSWQVRGATPVTTLSTGPAARSGAFVAGPGGPGGPGSPLSPRAPEGPAGPVSPFSPAGPAGPAMPCGPAIP